MNDTTMSIIGIIMMLAGIAGMTSIGLAADKARAAKQDRELAEAIKRGGK